MSIGYACLAIGVPGSNMKNCTLKNATEERLLSLIKHNLDSLEILIDYNIQNGIRLFRISSDLIPFGSSLAQKLPWREIYAEKLADIGGKIRESGMRVSMHPGQYTVLNSPDPLVVERAVDDLRYHAGVLDGLSLGSSHKIILHLGGAYGDKELAKRRFSERYRELPESIRKRLVLENDDKLFHIVDILDVASTNGIPAIYDTLHNEVNPAERSKCDADWIRICAGTWKQEDGRQKIHYSQQHPLKKPGAHSDSVQIDAFLEFCRGISSLNPDIMLEVKNKNVSALKCIHCVSNHGIRALEAEWARYKYCVLERSDEIYQSVRSLLKNKRQYPALEMYRMTETAFQLPEAMGARINAAQHVWGYFKNDASDYERRHFYELIAAYPAGKTGIKNVKSYLRRLAEKYGEHYLLNSYYFEL